MITSISYFLYTPSLFKVTTTIQKSNQNLHNKYRYLNDILRSEIEDISPKKTLLKIDNHIQFKVDSLLIFQKFINEFNDYEEIITVLSNNNYIKDKIKYFNDEEKRKILISFAKKFSIKKHNNVWQISFIWHDVDEGSLLLNKALKQTLINVRKSLLLDINNIANSIDLKNKRRNEFLNAQLNSIREINKLTNAKRTRYLIEQSDIAKELGIEKNQLDKLTIESPDYPYYLRGFKAINKELELIKNRSNQDNDLMSEGYLKIKRKLLLIEKDIRSKQLRDADKVIKKDNISNWVNFNLELSDINSIKRSPYFYILNSLIAGGIIGILYVLISKRFKERKNI